MNCSAKVELPYNERSWYVYVIVSVGIYLSGFFFILIGRVLWKVFKKWQFQLPEDEKDSRKPMEEYKTWYLQLKEFAVNLDTGKSFLGKCLVVTSFFLNIIAFCSYLVLSYKFPIEYCDKHDFANGLHTHIWLLELCLYSFFAFHFLIRFIIATDKLTFWGLDPYTIVDIFTIPIVIIQAQQRKAWLGLRFLRVVYLQKLPDILMYLNLMEPGKTFQISQIVANFVTVVLGFSGVVHLAENSGDFWAPYNYTNRNSMNYFECLYFMIVTFSTVGYGDLSCKTLLGRIFCIFAILSGLGIFATSIPAIFEFLSTYTKYDRKFKATPGKKHVIVTGQITDDTVSSFIQDFLHPDRQCESNVTVVFLAPMYPSMLIEQVIQKHPSSVYFFKGSVYSLQDCNRVKMKQAHAVILLCDKKSPSPEAEDAANITRVVSVKKYFSKTHIRCIVQLMRRDNKALLENTARWNKTMGDAIVCIDELKYGFMAQNCYAPGFSTLLANLFVMRSNEKNKGFTTDTWRQSYMHGVSCEIYSTTLSNYFENMTFPKAAAICFSELGLLLIAVEYTIGGENIFIVNPNESITIKKETRAFLIAQDSKSVKKARKYCGMCHKRIVKLRKKLPECTCFSSTDIAEIMYKPKQESRFPPSIFNLHEINPRTSFSIERTATSLFEAGSSTIYGTVSAIDRFSAALMDMVKQALPNDYNLFDFTGTYFWCPERKFDDSIMTIDEVRNQEFFEHVVVVVIADNKSPVLGLRELVSFINISKRDSLLENTASLTYTVSHKNDTQIQPLRASNQQAKDLKKIILLGDDEKFLRREWMTISTFPGVYVVQGSPYRQVNLHAVNVQLADLVIILSPPNVKMSPGLAEVEKPVLADKEVIMVTMNLRAMQFEHYKSGETPVPLKKRPNSWGTMFPKNIRDGNGNNKEDEESKARKRLMKRCMSSNVEYRIRQKNNESIRMVTELTYDSNTLYIEESEIAEFKSEGIWMTESYACGSVFTDSVLDFLASATYFNQDILTLIRNLVTGSFGTELDIILSQGKQPEGTIETPDIRLARKRCRVEQLALNDDLFKGSEDITTFGELFMKALSTHGTLCLGLYRLHNEERRSKKSLNKRYVINFPPEHFLLEENDFVYVLLQFEEDSRTMSTVHEEHEHYFSSNEQKIELGDVLNNFSKL